MLGATLVHETLLVIFPAIYSILTDYKLESRMIVSVTDFDLLQVMTGESVFVMMFALGLVVDLQRSAQPRGYLIAGQISERTEQLLLYILVVVGCLVYAPYLLYKVDSDAGSMMAQLAWWLEGVFWFSTLIACAFIVTKRGEFSSRPVLTILAAIPLISLVVIGLTLGVRGRIIWAVSLLLIAGIFNGQKKFIAFSLIVAILLLPVFAALGDRETRGIIESNSSRTEKLTLVYDLGTQNLTDYQELLEGFLDSFAWRAQGLRNSVILFQDFESGGGGFMTYLGTIFAPVPRVFWAEKPMLGSLDHTVNESAMYKVMLLGHGEPGTMGPYLASAHAYWEGGWIWLVVAGLITGLFWNMIFYYCRQLPDSIAAIIILTFAAALLTDGLLTMLAPLHAYIIRCWLSLLPLFIIYKGILIFTKERSYVPR